MKKVLIMLDNGVEDIEFLYSFHRFQEAGYKVDVVASKGKETYVGDHGVPMESDLSPEEVNIDEYVALVIPGGRAPDSMRLNKGLINVTKQALEKGLVIAAVCHGLQMLIELDALRGKKVTSWYAIKTDLKNAGATWIDTPVVVDGKLVTARYPPDLGAFCREALNLLKEQ